MFKLKLVKLKIVVLYLLIFVGLTACSSVPEEPMKLATNDWLGYRPMYLAKELEFIEDKDLHLVELTSASEVMRNFRNGVIDAAALTLDEVLLLKQDGLDFKIILVTDISHGGDVIVARSNIQSMRSLKGKKIGVEKTALGAYVLSRALELSNVHSHEVEAISLEYSEHQKAFDSGEVDAVVTFEPVRSHLLKSGGNIVFDSTQIPGEIVDVLVVNSEYLTSYPEKVKRGLDAWFRAIRYMQSNSDKAISLLSPMSNLSTEEYRIALEGIRIPSISENRKLLSNGENNLATTITKLQSVMLGKQLLDKEIDAGLLLTNPEVGLLP